MSGTLNISQDRFDKGMYRELRSASGELKNLTAGDPIWDGLMNDYWATYYKPRPELSDQVDQDAQFNRPFVERLLEDSETKKAKATTTLDELSSAVATIEAGKQLQQEFNERKELQEAQAKARQAERERRTGNPEKAEQLMSEAMETLDGNATDVRRAVRKAMEAGKQEAEQLEGSLAGWGLESSDLEYLPMPERLRLAERLTTTNLKEISELVGRMRNLARARQKSKATRARDELHSVTVGDDVNRLLPMELGNLGHPTRKKDFYRRLQEKQAQQYALRGQEKLARGPLVCLVDVSGSMSGYPITWAIATALGVVDTAVRQKRSAYVIFFNGSIKQEYEFPKGIKKHTQKMLEMANIQASGGTNFEKPISRALEIIQGNTEYKEADLIMVTDGQCMIQNEQVSEILGTKKDLECKAWSVVIGRVYEDDQMYQWNDGIWAVNPYDHEGLENTSGEIFSAIY